MSDAAKAIEASAQALSKAMEVAPDEARSGFKFLGRLVQPFAVAADILSDQLRAWQWGNRVKILNRARVMLGADPDAALVVPPGFLLPLVREAGDIEEPDLQEMWARLLVSGVRDANARHPAFVPILRQMSAAEALVLKGVNRARVLFVEVTHHVISSQEFEEDWITVRLGSGLSESQGRSGLLRLKALGLVNESRQQQSGPGSDARKFGASWTLTEFGNALVKACIWPSAATPAADARGQRPPAPV